MSDPCGQLATDYSDPQPWIADPASYPSDADKAAYTAERDRLTAACALAQKVAPLKSHLNLTGLAETDDSDLALKFDAAILFTSDRIEIEGGDPLVWDNTPPDLKQAILMLAAHWYANRETVLIGMQAAPTPYGYDDLVRSYCPNPWVF